MIPREIHLGKSCILGGSGKDGAGVEADHLQVVGLDESGYLLHHHGACALCYGVVWYAVSGVKEMGDFALHVD